jgi:flagellin
MRANAMIGVHQRLLERSMERLATGKRVNRASDDPTAITPISQFNARRAEIERKLRNMELNERYMGARDGLASVVGDQLITLRGLVVQAGNRSALSQDELDALQLEADSIIQGINFISNTYTFNRQQIGQSYTASSLGLGRLDLINGDLDKIGEMVESSISGLAAQRGTIGAELISSEHERNALQEELIQLTSAQSQIEDTDYAKETSEFVRAQALQQVAMFVSRIAGKHSADTVLALVQGVGSRR